MDLAAIHLLDGEIQGVGFETLFPAREIKTGEFLVAAGYGFTENGVLGVRHFGINKVMGVYQESSDVLAFQGRQVPLRAAHTLLGDSGGPCFLEDTLGRRWLVGIISYGRHKDTPSQMSAFTSIFRHLDWVRKQLANSEWKPKTD